MAIAKVNMGNGFTGVINYVLNKKDNDKNLLPVEQQPKIIECHNLFQAEPNIMASQMRDTALNNSSKKPVMHMQIAFDKNETICNEQALKAVNSIMADIGINRETHQFLIVEHFNQENTKHYHIVCNRIGFDNKLLNDSQIRIKLNVACDKVEKLQGLKQTEFRKWQYDEKNDKGVFVKVEKTKEQLKKLPNEKEKGILDAKVKVQDEVIEVLQTAKDTDEFKIKLAEKGIEVRFSVDRKNDNAIRGASFRTDDIALKGGEIGFKWNEINACLEHNQQHSTTSKAAALATLVQQGTEVKKLISIEQFDDSIKNLPLKRQKELWVKHATIIEGKQVETRAILADTTISEGKRQQLTERLNGYIVLEPKIKAYYKAVNDKILLEEVAVKPVGKQAEMENQIIILERRLIEIKEYAKDVEKENTNDYKALNEVALMKNKANRELLNARNELAEYKHKVEHLQEQNEDLTILQIDKIIKEQEEKGEQRGNSNSMGI